MLTSNPKVQPITVALNNLAGSFSVQWNVQMAGALLAALPTLLVYMLLGPLLPARPAGRLAEGVAGRA